MAGLPREILKWLQSLDLSYSVKNVRRDFSNGFLVAEIFSRYYPNDIQMHSFDNGTGKSKKEDNWALLEKFFKKKGIPISRAEFEPVIECVGGSATPIIQSIYTFLTNRSIPAPPKPSPTELIPPFARPTASQLVKDSEAAKIVDNSVASSKAQEIVDKHNETLRSERTLDAARFSTTKSSRILRGTPRPVEKEAEMSVVEIKEVNVKSVDKNIAHLRASRDMQMQMQMSSQGSRMSAGSSASRRGPSETGSLQASYSARPFEEAASAVLRKVVEGASEAKMLDPRRELVVAFCDALPKISEQLATAAFEEINLKADTLTESVLRSPKDFWSLFSTLGSGLNHLLESSPSYQALVIALVSIGERVSALDESLSQRLLTEFALPRLAPLLLNAPDKRLTLCRVLYAFSADDAASHISVIRSLQESLRDLTVFVQCLSRLLPLEREMTEDLLDLYLYYAISSLTQPSPHLRTDAVNMLTHFARHSHLPVLNNIGKLAALSNDNWWEVRAQLLVCVCTLLEKVPAQIPQAEALYAIVHAVFHEQAHKSIQRIGLCSLAPVLLSHPSLAGRFVSVFLVQTAPVRHALLHDQPTTTSTFVLGPSSHQYSLFCISSFITNPTLAQALCSQITLTRPDHLEIEHVQLLLATLEAPIADSDLPLWVESFGQLKEYLFVALCDQDLCAPAVKILSGLLMDVRLTESLIKASMPTFLSSMRLLFSNGGDPGCRDQVTAFLRALYDFGEPLSSAVYSLLRTLADKQPDLITLTQLNTLYSQVSRARMAS